MGGSPGAADAEVQQGGVYSELQWVRQGASHKEENAEADDYTEYTRTSTKNI